MKLTRMTEPTPAQIAAAMRRTLEMFADQTNWKGEHWDASIEPWKLAQKTLALVAAADAETDGQLLQRLGANAALWAAEFRKTAIKLGYSDMDEGWLIGWFANAIENTRAVDRAAITSAAYRKLGIDPANPNPDGSDFHLMSAVDAERSSYVDWMIALNDEFNIHVTGPQEFIKWAREHLTIASATFPHAVLLVNSTIEKCAEELEAAYSQCSTLNLLHGAARLRAMKK